MKKLFAVIALSTAIFTSSTVSAQEVAVKKPAPDKSKRASPPAVVTETLKSGAVVTIDYSQPALKNRLIGKDIAPFDKIWRTGANEATTFEVSKNITIEGVQLPAGKYSLYTIPGEQEWTVILNKDWNQWGTVYKQDQDQLRVKVKSQTSTNTTEMLTYLVSKDGEVSINWGNIKVPFRIQ